MIGNSIGKRYAKALINIETGDTAKLEKVGSELESILLALSKDNVLKNVFSNPLYDIRFKKKLITVVLEKIQAAPETANFLKLLIDKDRICFFPEIVGAYLSYVDEIIGRVKANVKTAFPLIGEETAKLKTDLEKWSGKKVVLNVEVDKELIGGILVRIGSYQFDGSIKNQLKNIKDSLMKG